MISTIYGYFPIEIETSIYMGFPITNITMFDYRRVVPCRLVIAAGSSILQTHQPMRRHGELKNVTGEIAVARNSTARELQLNY